MRAERFDQLTRRGALGLLAGLAASRASIRAAAAKACMVDADCPPCGVCVNAACLPLDPICGPHAPSGSPGCDACHVRDGVATACRVRPRMRASRTAAPMTPTAVRVKPASAACALRSIRCASRMGRSARRRAIAATAATPAACACRHPIAAGGDIATIRGAGSAFTPARAARIRRGIRGPEPISEQADVRRNATLILR